MISAKVQAVCRGALRIEGFGQFRSEEARIPISISWEFVDSAEACLQSDLGIFCGALQGAEVNSKSGPFDETER